MADETSNKRPRPPLLALVSMGIAIGVGAVMLAEPYVMAPTTHPLQHAGATDSYDRHGTWSGEPPMREARGEADASAGEMGKVGNAGEGSEGGESGESGKVVESVRGGESAGGGMAKLVNYLRGAAATVSTREGVDDGASSLHGTSGGYYPVEDVEFMTYLRRLEDGDDTGDDNIVESDPSRIAGVGWGVFILLSVGGVFIIICLITCQPGVHNNPLQICMCGVYWYTLLVLYLVFADREDQYYDTKSGSNSEALSWRYKYLFGVILFCGAFCSSIHYLWDYSSEELYQSPPEALIDDYGRDTIKRSSL